MEINHNEQMSNISRLLYEKYGENINDYQREFLERGYTKEDILNYLIPFHLIKIE